MRLVYAVSNRAFRGFWVADESSFSDYMLVDRDAMCLFFTFCDCVPMIAVYRDCIDKIVNGATGVYYDDICVVQTNGFNSCAECIFGYAEYLVVVLEIGYVNLAFLLVDKHNLTCVSMISSQFGSWNPELFAPIVMNMKGVKFV